MIYRLDLLLLIAARDVAEAILYLASDRAGFVTGQVLGVNGGMVV